MRRVKESRSVISKASASYFITLGLGCILYSGIEISILSSFDFHTLISMSYLFIVTTIVCLPLLALSMVFYSLMKIFKPYPPINYFVAGLFGLSISLPWAFIFQGMEDAILYYYIVSATLAFPLTEYLF